ncbi:MAG: hypothetical protein Salg2KO_11860 [Salibacteraceae bacterium]
MIKNGSFESVSKKIKGGGTIEYAYPWKSPTDAKADVFSPKAKSDDYKTPINVYGDTDPLDGSNYAGILIYSYKDGDPRQYLQIELEEKMEEDKVYCVKMNVMLSMLSKYSSNNIGMYLSKKPLTAEEIEARNLEPQVIHSQNRIFEEMFDWEPICQTYIADGGEEYLTIGNFASTDATETDKVKKPKGITGQQARGAYYYIDDVSVMNMAGVEECDCELDAGGNSINVVYSVETSSEVEVDVSEDIQRTRIYFDDGSSEINEMAGKDIAKIATLLTEHPKYKVKVVGHTDPVEEAQATGNLSQDRANIVRDKLVELGVPENKLLVVGLQDFEPVSTDGTPAGQAQNRRVMFNVISKN